MQDFTYFGEEVGEDIPEDEVEDTPATSKNAKPTRGKDHDWINWRTFQNNEDFSSSELIDEIKNNFSCRKKLEYDYGDVHIYMCKMNRRKGFEKCSKQMRIVFPSDSLQVIIQETGNHEHIRKETGDLQVYKWSVEAERIIEMCLRHHATPTIVMRNLREQEVFRPGEEPPMSVLKNKIAYMKKILKINESIYTTHDLRTKLNEYLKKPADDNEGWVPYCHIQDEGDQPTRFVVIFTTNNLLERLKSSSQLHIDATYKLNFQDYPVFLCGVTSENGKFYGTMTVLSSHEDSAAWSEVYQFIHDTGSHFQYFMADGAKAITKAQEKVFSQCEECNPGKRLMCYPHVHRNLNKKNGSVDKDTRAKLMKDIGDLQWSATSEKIFRELFEKLKEKYSGSGSEIDDFLQYIEDVWIESKENQWYEGARPYGCSNNQGLEAKNAHIKQSYTLRRKLPLGTFINVMMQLVNEMSQNDDSLLTMKKSETLFDQSDSLAIRTNGYSWYQEHKADKFYVKVRLDGRRTVMEDIDVLWVVPSSNSNDDLKTLAASRLDQRWETTSRSFDESIKIRSSCYIIEQKGKEFYCDCFVGSKGHLCKHSVGLMYKTGTIEVTSDVRSKPLGPKKRGKGRPKKNGHCLTITPPREVRLETQEVIPTAQYHERSPELRTISLPRANIAVSPPTLTLADVDIENIEIIIETPVESPVLPRRTRRKRGLVSDDVRTPPAKKIALSYMEPEQLIVSIEKPKTRGRRNKK